MHKIDPPRYRVIPVLHALAKANPTIHALKTQIRKSQAHYVLAGRSPSQLPSLQLNSDTTKWMEARYKAAPKNLGLGWIKQLRENHAHVSCPMCGGTNVTALDHILPKSLYAEFAVFSYNLVPSCHPCNSRRLQQGATPNQPAFIHPYFDHQILDALKLSIEFSAPYHAVKFIRWIDGVEDETKDRVKRHLDLSINERVFTRTLNALWAAWWSRTFQTKDVAATQTLISAELKIHSCTSSLNSWEAAFLRGLVSDTSAITWMERNSPSLKI
jgi:hypothetical protein